jgi:hypothetical protein
MEKKKNYEKYKEEQGLVGTLEHLGGNTGGVM